MSSNHRKIKLPSPRYYPLALFISFGLFYIITADHNQGFDSYSYALSVKNGTGFFHPHHLLYNFVGYLLYRIFSFTGIGSLTLLSLLNTFAGVMSLTLVFGLVRKVSDNHRAVIATAATGLLFSFWYYSTSAEVNLLALTFLLLALYYLLARPPTIVSSVWIYLFLAFGIFFHQVICLAVLPVMIYDLKRQGFAGRMIKQALPGLLLCFSVYLLVALFEAPEISLAGAYRWFTFYGHLGAWGNAHKIDFIAAGWGLIKTFFGGDIIRIFFYSGKSSPRTYVSLTVMLLAWSGLTWLFVSAVRELFKVGNARQWFLFVLTSIFGLFAFWWAPADDGFWLYAAVLLLIFIFSAQRLSAFTRKKPLLFITVGLVIFGLLNTIYEFIPATDRKNSVIIQAEKVFERLDLTPSDLVLTSYSQARLAYEYFHNIQVPTACLLFSGEGKPSKVLPAYHEKIDSALAVGRVIIFENELFPERSRRYLFTRYTPDDYAAFYQRYRPYLVPIDSLTVYGHLVHVYELSKSYLKR